MQLQVLDVVIQRTCFSLENSEAAVASGTKVIVHPVSLYMMLSLLSEHIV